MTPRTAEEKLAGRRKANARKPGPPSLAFGPSEIAAVRTLAAHGHTSLTIAVRAGLSSKQFKKARERDSKLDEALAAGRAEERLRINQALLKTALDPKNPRQVQAAVTLMKARHGYVDGKGGVVDVDVSITNQVTLPGPLDERKYKRLIKEAAKDNGRTPAIIEHKSGETLGPRLPVDPIAEVMRKQKESNDAS